MSETTETTIRSNQAWLEDLAAEGARQDAALSELRAQLRRGLYAFLRDQRSDMTERDTEDLGQLAEDFAQEAMLKILDSLATFRGESRFTTWAMKIAVRTAISGLRRATYKDLSLNELEERGAALRLSPDDFVRPAAAPDPQLQAERNEVLTALGEAVQEELTDRQRTAFLATEVGGAPVETVAKLMGSNRNALYKLVHDARRRLRDALIERGFTFERVAPMFAGD